MGRNRKPQTHRTTTRPGYVLGRADPAGPTLRQREVMELTLAGMKVWQIAKQLGMIKQQVSRTLDQLVRRGDLERLPARYLKQTGRVPPLPERERLLLDLVLAGKSREQMAAAVGISKNAVSWTIGQKLVREKKLLRYEPVRYVRRTPPGTPAAAGDSGGGDEDGAGLAVTFRAGEDTATGLQ